MDITHPGQQLIFYFDVFVEFVLYLFHGVCHILETILFHNFIVSIWRDMKKSRIFDFFFFLHTHCSCNKELQLPGDQVQNSMHKSEAL